MFTAALWHSGNWSCPGILAQVRGGGGGELTQPSGELEDGRTAFAITADRYADKSESRIRGQIGMLREHVLSNVC